MTFVVVTLSGAIGAACRYLISGAVQERSSSGLPMGTLAVNLSGAFAIGLVAGATTPGSPEATAIIGFLGGYTTYSTWMVETLRLGLVESRPQAMINLTLTLVLGIALTAAGYSLG